MAVYKLNLIPQKAIVNISCSQNDHLFDRIWQFELYNGHDKANVTSGSAVSIVASNGKSLNALSVSGNVVTFKPTSTFTEKPGHYKAKIFIADGENRLFSSSFNLWVEGLNGN